MVIYRPSTTKVTKVSRDILYIGLREETCMHAYLNATVSSDKLVISIAHAYSDVCIASGGALSQAESAHYAAYNDKSLRPLTAV